MKEIKNILSLSIVALCTFCVLGVADVYAAAGANNFRVACEKTSLEKGDETNCYILAQITNDDITSAGIDGVMAVINENTKQLAVGDPMPAPAKESEMLTMRLSSGQNPSGDVSDGAKNYSCKYDKCDMFLAKKSSTKKLDKAESWSANNVSEITGFSNYTVLGRYVVHLQDTATMKDCGKLCVDIKYSAAGLYDDGNFSSGGTVPCAEIKPIGSEDPEGNPGSGSFTSYIVLVGGLFVALGAIALARKNNKFYRV